MEKEAFRWWLGQRTRDLNTGFAFYGFVTALLLGILALSGSDFGSSLQLAYIVITIGLGIFAWLWIDGSIADLKNGTKDVPQEEEDSTIVKNYKKSPFMFFRVLIGLIILATTASLVFGAIGS